MRSIEEQWKEVEVYLLYQEHEIFARLLPLFTAAKNDQFLRQLFPYLSHERLCFSVQTFYPWSYEYPCCESIPNMSEFNTLIALKGRTRFRATKMVLQDFLDSHPFLPIEKQSYIRFDEQNKIVRINRRSDTIEWLLEQTRGMYTVFENASLDQNTNTILGMADIGTAIELLIKRIKTLNE